MSVICFGEALIDFLSNGQIPESFTKYAGGAPANVAVGISKLGGQSAFCGMLGDDMFGHFLHKELSDFGVNVDYCVSTSAVSIALLLLIYFLEMNTLILRCLLRIATFIFVVIA